MRRSPHLRLGASIGGYEAKAAAAQVLAEVARVAPHVDNTEEELDRLLVVLDAL